MKYIELLWLHIWNYTTPVEEVMRSLDGLVRCGKVLYTGISDTPALIVSAANIMEELRTHNPLVLGSIPSCPNFMKCIHKYMWETLG